MSVVAIDIEPADGATIARFDPLTFRLLYDDLAQVVIAVVYPDGRREVVFSGGSFAPVFAFSSTAQDIGDGLGSDLVVRRTGGWDAAPSLSVDEAPETVPGWGYPFGG